MPLDEVFNINQGDPDMMRFWTAEEELPEWMSCARQRKKNKDWSAEEGACGNRKKCLYCQTRLMASQARDENLHDSFVAATVLLTKEKMVDPAWEKLETTTLYDFVMSVYDNVKGTRLEKSLAHIGGVRMTKEEIIAAGQKGHGKTHYPVMYWSDNSIFYQSVQDLSNYAYSTWLKAVAEDVKRALPSTNQEKLGDMVEAVLSRGLPRHTGRA